MTLLTIDELSVKIGSSPILNSVTFELQQGKIIGLMGANGSGKSTLLKAIADLIPYSGQICWRGQPIKKLPLRARAKTIGYLGQSRLPSWSLSVRDFVALGRLPFEDRNKNGGKKILEKSIFECDLADLSDRLITQLSGGELARARIARVIAGEPTLLLLDEPIAGLDPLHQLEIMHLLQEKVSEGLTVFLVLHDLSLAARFTNRLILLKEGCILVEGPTAPVLNSTNLAEAFKINSRYCVTDGIPYVVPTYPIKTLSEPQKG